MSLSKRRLQKIKEGEKRKGTKTKEKNILLKQEREGVRKMFFKTFQIEETGERVGYLWVLNEIFYGCSNK